MFSHRYEKSAQIHESHSHGPSDARVRCESERRKKGWFGNFFIYNLKKKKNLD